MQRRLLAGRNIFTVSFTERRYPRFITGSMDDLEYLQLGIGCFILRVIRRSQLLYAYLPPHDTQLCGA